MKELYSKRSLLEKCYWSSQNLDSVKWVSWIYFLIWDSSIDRFWLNDIIYIGKSKDIWKRIFSHNMAKQDFSAWTYLEFDENFLDYREWVYIIHFKPVLNQKYNAKSEFIKRALFIKKYKDKWMNLQEINKYLKTTDYFVIHKHNKLYSTTFFEKKLLSLVTDS